ncbi:SWPV1-052 [Shearwaterpox virus]|uniref:DNA ligase n=1 Tax=Shearwaterpox virus TaxID=1974596 RepID=A0A1V0S7R5_CNPV|nr:SWPV1-052 [Shearwaterpox virus]
MELYFKKFRALCLTVSRETSYIGKTELIHDFVYDEYKKSNSVSSVYIIIKLLLPGVDKLIYNISDKQIIKLFSKILKYDVEEINKYVIDTGDVAYVIGSFLKRSTDVHYATESTLMLRDIDCFLTKLSTITKECDQIRAFKKLIPRCTPNDLRYVIRLVKHDLRMNIGPKHVLAALHKDAYDMFKVFNDLEHVVEKSLENNIKPVIKPMIPIHPMLASVCKTFSEAKKKCKGGIMVEFKYDGERVQVHKDGENFKFFSRTLKSVTPHKVSSFEELLTEAFPTANNMILDGEIILVDKDTNTPLPFGTLGINKKSVYNNACICFFIFDCLYFNDINMLDKPLKYRRETIIDNIVEISNRILLSEIRIVDDDKELVRLLKIILSKGIEGFVLKDEEGIYEPGMRRWLKIKKDYLDNGNMADKADLLVLGAYYGKGNKSGLLSSFLMGCYDKETGKWCTVTKCSGGHTDAELKEICKSIKVVPFDKSNIPDWILLNKAHYPDVIVKDINTAPVWEIAGSEFTKSPTHTAANISIRFPRCVRVRNDKDFKTANTLDDIKALYILSINPQEK